MPKYIHECSIEELEAAIAKKRLSIKEQMRMDNPLPTSIIYPKIENLVNIINNELYEIYSFEDFDKSFDDSFKDHLFELVCDTLYGANFTKWQCNLPDQRLK